jgi:ferrochelatase
MNSNEQKELILLINLGTPNSPSVKDVRKYLREFLMDRRVIDIPFWKRFLLVNCIIAPFRAKESSKIYKQLWTKEGSPLKIHLESITKSLQKCLPEQYTVKCAMRYQNPNIKSVLQRIEKKRFSKITVIPLYPQYASSSTGSTIEEVQRIIKNWEVIPSVKIISNFFENPLFIESFALRAKEWLNENDYDHFVFSYHGLPERQILKSSTENYCQINQKCCSKYHNKNQFCYRAQCFKTTRLLAKTLNIAEDKYTVCFQSRLGKDPWIKPYTDEVIVDLTNKGVKSVLAFSPAFIADCLETTIEVGVEYKELFLENGGQRWDLVKSLNNEPSWIKCLENMVLTA